VASASGNQADNFDYIIVGAGSAGCVLADRLSASGQHKLMLLEACPADKHFWIHVPLGYGKLFQDPRVNWMYQTEPEAELNRRSVIAPRGKVLGGSSSINGLLYVRGQHEDFDHWRQLGNTGWSFEDVLPFFRKAEDQQRGSDRLHGSGGPLAVSDVKPHKLCEAFIEACEEAGHPRNKDFNGETQEGAGYFQLTARNGRRCSTARGYLKPARGRSNLHVESSALATRILFEGRRAAGVEYRQNGVPRQARANGEVILSGGAFNSPQLMQLSGVGPADLLRQHGIGVIADMPGVGADLQDHFQVRFNYRCTEPITVNDMMAKKHRQVMAGLRYLIFRDGPLSIGAGYAGGFFKTDRSLPTPDVQLHFILFSAESVGQKLHPFPGFLASVCQLRPRSRGSVAIKSADPAAAPAIHMRYMSDPFDQEVIVAGMKLTRKIMSQPAVARYVDEELVPGAGVQSDADMLACARDKGTTVFHPTSTCRMGPDAKAVVDQRLRVKGFDGLRVIDASIMPAVVSGNTNAAAIMIAEKGAAMLLEDAKRSSSAASVAA
jgi:choline dehydrogenase